MDIMYNTDDLMYRMVAKRKYKIGIPFTMLTYEFYPFWDAFFTELGLEVVLSDKTNRKIINDGLAYVDRRDMLSR